MLERWERFLSEEERREVRKGSIALVAAQAISSERERIARFLLPRCLDPNHVYYATNTA